MKLQFLVIAVLLFCCKTGFAQSNDIRKLQAQLPLSADSIQYTNTLNKISLFYCERSADSMCYYAIKARDIAHRLNYQKGEADAANNLGIFDEIRGNTQEAFRYYLDAYNRYSLVSDKPNMVQTAMNIALMYCEMEKPEKSLVNFRKAFSLTNGIESDSITALLYANYVNCFSSRLSEDSIAYYIKQAKEISIHYKDHRTELYTDQLLAENLAKRYKVKNAVDLLKSTLQAALRDSLFFSASSILIDLGDNVSDSVTAANYYFQSVAIAQSKGFRANLRYAYEQLYDFYQNKNDDASSLVYGEKLLSFYDEQKSIDNNSGIDYIDYALMDKTLAQSLLTSQYRQRMLWLTIAICVLFFVLIVILLRNGRKMRKTTRILKTQFAQTELSMETLDRMNKNYARVIKVVAHDLRNPLSSINMVSEIMEPNMSASEMQKLVTIIKKTSKGCFDLIEELLHTDLDEGFQLDKKEVSLDDILLQSINLLNFKAKEKQQQIVVTNNLHLMFFADGDKIIRVINNLVVNAIKFSQEGTSILIKTFPVGSNVVITVTDTGIGIPESMAKHIFDPFTSAKRKGTNGENTFGLGLYISKQIVEAHGGYIWFKSTLGEGTTFYVELPVTPSHQLSGSAVVLEENRTNSK